ncbi:hypothetical protein ACFRQM_44035 [Streptomyces sp. NPDC056831]|uniref:hypothetical protein n=1 Tax=Streptomyces sp. NPDC056831 TaxID=3345954 RepID=UPI0036784B27
MAIEPTDELIQLQRAAVDAQKTAMSASPPEGAWTAWRKAAERVQAAITEHAAATGENRVDVEMAVKKAVRHPEPTDD